MCYEDPLNGESDSGSHPHDRTDNVKRARFYLCSDDHSDLPPILAGKLSQQALTTARVITQTMPILAYEFSQCLLDRLIHRSAYDLPPENQASCS